MTEMTPKHLRPFVRWCHSNKITPEEPSQRGAMSEMTPETLPTMPYSEDTRTCAKACMAVLPPNDAMYLWLQIYLEHTAALQAHIEALEKIVVVLYDDIGDDLPDDVLSLVAECRAAVAAKEKA